MPEGPSIVLLKEVVETFKGKKIISTEGNTKTIDRHRLENKKILDFKSWGKHFLICFSDFVVRIHFLMFGSYSINTTKDKPVRLGLHFKKGYINFYTCSIKILDEDLDNIYDWSGDVMNDKWNQRKAITKLKELPGDLVCDTLLNQGIFAGVGNIIKNEVLFRIRVQPESIIGKLPNEKIKNLVGEARKYSFDFLKWKRIYELKKHYCIYTRKTCPRCDIPVTRKTNREIQPQKFFLQQLPGSL